MPPLRRFACALLGMCVVAALVSPVTTTSAAEPAAAGIRYRSTATASEQDSDTLTVSQPGGVTSGDLLVARVANRGDVLATMSAAGWTPAGETHSAAMLKSWVFYRFVTATDPGSYTFRQNASTGLVGSISAFSGVDRADPIDDFGGQVNGNKTAFLAPDVTSTSGNDVAAWFGTQLWAGSDCPISAITAPSGFVESADGCLESGAGLVYDTAYRQLGAAGPQPATLMAPAAQLTWSGSSLFAATNLTQVLLLRPAGDVEVADRYSAGTVRVGSFSVPDDVLHEPSGLAVSRVNPGVIYTHSEIDDKTMVAISADHASVLAEFTLGDERHGEAALVDLSHRQRHAVDGYRALLDHVAQELGRSGHADHSRRVHLGHALDRPGAVHVPLHDVAAHRVPGAQRQLEVDLVALGERTERAAVERLRHQVGSERAVVGVARGEAYPVHRDRLARAELGRQRCPHAQAGAGADALDRLDGALVGHQPREHQRVTTR